MVTRAFCLAALCFSMSTNGQSLPADLLEQKLREQVRALDRNLDGALGVAAIDLTSGRVFTHNADTIFPTASVIKVPILIEMFRLARAGEFSMQDRITLEPGELVGGSGELQHALRKGPVTLTVLDLVTAMVEHSDNTATNRAIRMARMDRVNRRTQELGLAQTRLRRIMLDAEAATKGMENVSTPLEMARLMELIFRSKAGDPEDCKEMMRILKLVRADVRAAVPSAIEVASKPGDLVGVKCETAIVLHPRRPFIVSIFSSYLKNEENPVFPLARMIFAYFDSLGGANSYGNRGVR